MEIRADEISRILRDQIADYGKSTQNGFKGIADHLK